MKLHHLILVVLFSLPMIFAPQAQAWSPLQHVESYFDTDEQCDWRVISEGNSDEGENEEDEEPDCE